MPNPHHDALLENARALRRNMTPWERKLWYLFLRGYPAKYYKQQIIGPYVVDFCCPRAKLIIELDGSQHFMPEGQSADARRTADLEAMGYSLLRFPNIEVDRHFPEVCEHIRRETEARIRL